MAYMSRVQTMGVSGSMDRSIDGFGHGGCMGSKSEKNAVIVSVVP